MKVNKIQNGSLYFNTNRNRVERIRSTGVNTSSVMVTHHGDAPLLAKASDLRVANELETNKYLEEAGVLVTAV
tara:strand:+ start:4268 stop:4486 length:219 start_codon:yes stop_codon:yes gene_type:complete